MIVLIWLGAFLNLCGLALDQTRWGSGIAAGLCLGYLLHDVIYSLSLRRPRVR